MLSRTSANAQELCYFCDYYISDRVLHLNFAQAVGPPSSWRSILIFRRHVCSEMEQKIIHEGTDIRMVVHDFGARSDLKKRKGQTTNTPRDAQ